MLYPMEIHSYYRLSQRTNSFQQDFATIHSMAIGSSMIARPRHLPPTLRPMSARSWHRCWFRCSMALTRSRRPFRSSACALPHWLHGQNMGKTWEMFLGDIMGINMMGYVGQRVSNHAMGMGLIMGQWGSKCLDSPTCDCPTG